MRARFVVGGIVCGALAGLFACTDPTDPPPPPDSMPDRNTAAATALSPLPAVPADPTNAKADDPQAAKLGQMMFFDKSFSGAIAVAGDSENGGLGAVGDTGKVSCASCHFGQLLDDQRSKPGNVSLGTDFGTRRALALVNSSFYTWTNWAGRFDSQWSLPLAVAENATIMKSTRLQIVHTIFAKYKAEYEAIFPALDPRLDPANANAANFPPSGKPKAMGAADGPWEMMAAADQLIVNTIFANYGKATAAYLRKLVSGNAAFDKYAAGDKSAISASADRGFGLFLGKAQCIACHNGPHFSDGDFHALGLPQDGPHVPAVDLGRFTDVATLLASPFNTAGAFSDDKSKSKLTADGGALMQNAAQKGQFRTKSLRTMAPAGPYMHSGQLPTFEIVVAFYNAGGGDVGTTGAVKDTRLHPLGLTPEESADLVEFLKTLTGEAVPAALTTDTSKP